MTRSGRKGSWTAAAAAVVAVGLLTAGCTDAGPDRQPDPGGSEEIASPLADCTSLTAAPPHAPTAPPPAGDAAAALPDLTLACFTGDEPMALADLRGPAVVNLWASWCEPCRDELPALQRYADSADGQVHVVGVVTADTRAGAAWFATDAGVSFPALYDRAGQLLAAVPAVGLPATLLVDADGVVRHLHNRELDEETLRELVSEHLGVEGE